MKVNGLLIVVFCFFIASCHTPDQAETSKKATKVKKDTAPCAKGHTFEGRVKVAGQIAVTKGAQLVLDGHLLQMKADGDASAASRASLWEGKTVVLTGDRCIYRCKPREQCLVSGKIPFLSNIKVLSAK